MDIHPPPSHWNTLHMHLTSTPFRTPSLRLQHSHRYFPQSLTIDGLAHTRHQETDRILAMETELIRLGQDCLEHRRESHNPARAAQERHDHPNLSRPPRRDEFSVSLAAST